MNQKIEQFYNGFNGFFRIMLVDSGLETQPVIGETRPQSLFPRQPLHPGL